MKKDKIVITSWPLKDPFVTPDMVFNDEKLSNAITEYYQRELFPKNIELFEQKENCIATDSGTYGAFYESTLVHLK